MTAEGFQEWQLDIKVLDANPLYMNKVFRLKFKFSPQYPIGTLYSTVPQGLGLLLKQTSKQGKLDRIPAACFTYPTIHPCILFLPSTSTRVYVYLCLCPTQANIYLPNRTPRSNLHANNRPTHPHAPAHLLQRHHLPRPPRPARLEPRPERREHMHVPAEHADGQYQERETRGRPVVRGE